MMKTLKEIAICIWFHDKHGEDELWAEYPNFNSLPTDVQLMYLEEARPMLYQPGWLLFIEVMRA